MMLMMPLLVSSLCSSFKTQLPAAPTQLIAKSTMVLVPYNPILPKNNSFGRHRMIISKLDPRSCALFPSDLRIIPRINSFTPTPAISGNSSLPGVGLEVEEDQHGEEIMNVEENLLAAGLKRELMPKHVGLLLDGNRRWAEKNNLPPSAAHEKLLISTDLYRQCIQLGIPVLTAFVFGTIHFNRTQMEVELAMSNLEKHIKAQLKNFIKDGIKLSFIGDSSRLPIIFQEMITEVEEATMNNTKLHLIYAVGYGGQYDITQACKSIAHKAKDGIIQPEQIDESLFEKHLQTNCTEFPYPDFVIRTGGDFRLSNFCMWNLSYTELYFSQTLWPDFEETEFLQALRDFQQRRTGGRVFGHRIQ